MANGYFGVYLQWRVQSVHRGEQRGQRAGVRLAEEGGVQGRRLGGPLLSLSCRAYAVSALAFALEACSPEMEASLLASSEASA